MIKPDTEHLIEDALKDKLAGNRLVCTLQIESFMPYFKRVKQAGSSNYHFVPRLLTVRVFILDREYQTRCLELSE